MKRTLITFTMVITTLITASGQSQSPAAIAKKWDEIRHLCEKYDDGADSAYRILNEQIAATQTSSAKSRRIFAASYKAIRLVISTSG